ncbi:FXYD domain-containing ion transport regulator 5 isoform X1 [Neomonachus schauinslandi]|uniref:FXYD domain-containing ion transport regulator n=1 Tax=Neomonachus schauinslandi TaxID=29088 RepID=A0A2Y9I4S8_NEOSC|nr:FXYD domain-containing ion transport regulator 5 isoform X1 [Neomonachus schauinslandi]
MSPSGRLCLLTIVGLILPTRGHILKEATSVSPADPARVNVHALTPAPDAVYPEPQPTAQTTLKTGGTTQEQKEEIQTPKMEETQSPQPTGMDVLLATDPKTVKSGPEATPSAKPTKGTTLSKKQAPGKGVRPDPILGPTGSSEENPFSYDEHTLRKRGLLVAAVLFITGIVILTSGKCRRLPQLCRNRNR